MTKKKSAKPGPGYAGRFEVGKRVVVDPFDELGRKIEVTVNVRESAIEHMLTRKRIDRTQAAAGDRFRKMWELAAIGRQRGIDLTSAGGHSIGAVSDPLTDALVRAGRERDECTRALGMIRMRILTAVVGEGLRIEDVARLWSKATGIARGERAEGYITGTLIDALNDLVDLWGMEGKPKSLRVRDTYERNGKVVNTFGNIRASGPIDITGPSIETYVYSDGTSRTGSVIPVDRPAMTAHTSGNVGASTETSSARLLLVGDRDGADANQASIAESRAACASRMTWPLVGDRPINSTDGGSK